MYWVYWAVGAGLWRQGSMGFALRVSGIADRGVV